MIQNTTPPASSAPARRAPAPNALLEKQRTDLEAKLPPELKDDYTKIVTAGLALLFSDQTHEHARKVMQTIQQRGYAPKDIATGMLNALNMVAQESQGQANPEAMFPALLTLTSYVLEYMEATQRLTITPDLIKSVAVAEGQMYTEIIKQRPQDQQTPATPQPGGMLAQNPAAMAQGGAA